MKKNNSNIGFFKIIFEICSGTAIFSRLVNFRYIKALSHLIFLTLLCSFLVVLVNLPHAHRTAKQICKYMDSNFGKITFAHNGFFPEKKVTTDKKLTFRLTDFNVSVLYFPKVEKKEIDDLASNSSVFNILWIPPNILHCIKLKNNQFFIFQLNDNMLEKALFTQPTKENLYNKEQLLTHLNNLSAPNFPFEIAQTYSFISFIKTFTIFLLIPILRINLFQIPLTAIIYTLMVSLSYNFINKLSISSTQKPLTLKQVTVVATYSCFPGLIIASTLEALNISILNFQEVFIFCFMIYFLLIVNKLEQDNLKSERDLIRDKFNRK